MQLQTQGLSMSATMLHQIDGRDTGLAAAALARMTSTCMHLLVQHDPLMSCCAPALAFAYLPLGPAETFHPACIAVSSTKAGKLHAYGQAAPPVCCRLQRSTPLMILMLEHMPLFHALSIICLHP